MRRIRVAIAVLLLSGCAPASDDRAAPPAYLRLAHQDDIPTLDPARGYDTASWQFEEMLFNTLLDYNDEAALVPELAASWEVDADDRTYTFHLRDDVHFTNGRRLVASDVRYAIERVLTPHTRSPGAEFFRGIIGAEACTNSACSVAGIDTPDAVTLRITLRDIDPLFCTSWPCRLRQRFQRRRWNGGARTSAGTRWAAACTSSSSGCRTTTWR